MSGIDKLAEGVGKTVEILPGVYEDGLQKTTAESGELLALVPKTIKAALAPLRKWIAQKEYNVAETERVLAKKLEGISTEKIISPEGYVAVPALQSISYCMDSEELRNMYANLLSKSMVVSQKELVHPAFVEIIKQLSPDEAKLLKYLSSYRNSYPIIDVRIVNDKHAYQTIVQHFTNIAEGICEQPDNIYSYLDNLERLKLICIPWGVHISDDTVYEPLMNHKDIKEIQKSNVPEGWKIDIVKGKFDITSFGERFIDVCIEEIKE